MVQSDAFAAKQFHLRCSDQKPIPHHHYSTSLSNWYKRAFSGKLALFFLNWRDYCNNGSGEIGKNSP